MYWKQLFIPCSVSTPETYEYFDSVLWFALFTYLICPLLNCLLFQIEKCPPLNARPWTRLRQIFLAKLAERNTVKDFLVFLIFHGVAVKVQ